VDLRVLESLVSGRADEWTRLGITWSYVNNHPEAARVRCESPVALADLVVWSTGDADITWGRLDNGEATTEHYEVTSEIGLISCLDDLTSHLTDAR
jgi:hypothetical protein